MRHTAPSEEIAVAFTTVGANINSISAWSYGAAFVAFALTALHLVTRRQSGLPGVALAGALALSAVWSLLNSVGAATGQAQLLRAATFADILRTGAWYVFLLSLIAGQRVQDALFQVRGLTYTAIALVVAGVLFQALAAMDVSAGPPLLALLDTLCMAVFALVLVETLLRSLLADSLWNVKPLALGLLGAYGFDIYLYAEALLFNRIEVDAMSVRGLVHALATPLVAMTVVRNRQWRLPVTLSRHVVLHSTALLLSGTYLLAIAAAGYYIRFVGGEWGRAIQLTLIVAGILILGVLAVSGSMRAKLRVLISKHFFRYRYDYRDEWLRFTQTLSACDGQPALGEQIVRGLADMVESPGGSLWVRVGPGRPFAQTARWNMTAEGGTEDANGPLAKFLSETGWVINLEEYRASPVRYAELQIPPWLSAVSHAWLIVPLSTGHELIGFAVLNAPRTPVDVDWEVTDLLKTAGRQAASFLARMEASDALIESRKFDAFNRMSAFVVHDLKNIVTQLALMLRNADRHKGKPEFQQDMLMTVANSVERMKQLMMQLREGTTPLDAPCAVDLAETIRRVHHAKLEQRPLPELHLEEGVLAKCHEDRVQRVIGHLVQNALDATDQSGRIWVKLERQHDQAVVEVGDTGHGMTVDFMRERLFKPFQTTKSTGMGIGAYESYQYVQEIGGTILVDSTPDVGTRVRVMLPLHNKVGEVETRTAA